ncbi:MAG TPA: STAS domain-containing protein [Chthoniobacterales bacterium]|nr:STAS domain-containing protein [Chthoniobacterales bacterium]
MRLKEVVQDGVDVFALEGEIDLHFSPVLRELFQGRLREKCPALVLDFSGVQFIDSRGIATILEYLRDCGEYGGRVCLAALSPEVKPIFDTVRLASVMPIFMTVPEAISSMKNQREVQASR